MANRPVLAAATVVMAVPAVTEEPVVYRHRGPMRTTVVPAVEVVDLFKLEASVPPAARARHTPGRPVRREPLGTRVVLAASVLDHRSMVPPEVRAVPTWARVVR